MKYKILLSSLAIIFFLVNPVGSVGKTSAQTLEYFDVVVPNNYSNDVNTATSLGVKDVTVNSICGLGNSLEFIGGDFTSWGYYGATITAPWGNFSGSPAWYSPGNTLRFGASSTQYSNDHWQWTQGGYANYTSTGPSKIGNDLISFYETTYAPDDTQGISAAVIKAVCYGTSPKPHCYLQDCEYEEQPKSAYWIPVDDNNLAFGKFGRANDNSAWDMIFWQGKPECGHGYQVIGDLPYWYGFGSDTYQPILQEFNWPGGQFYFRVAGADMKPNNGKQAGIFVMLYGVTDPQAFYEVVPSHYFDDNSTTYQEIMPQSTYIPGGRYAIKIGSLGTDPVEIDNSIVDTSPITFECVSEMTTATPGTPTPDYGDNLIKNCGFGEYTNYWELMPGASIETGANNYGYIADMSMSPGFAQNFYVQQDGDYFLRFNSKGRPRVVIVSLETGQGVASMENPSGDPDNWHSYDVQGIHLTTGYYQVQFHYSTAGPESIDKISLSLNQFVDCVEGENKTPTPYPTQRNTKTPTITPGGPTLTFTPTRTVTPTPTLVVYAFTQTPTLQYTYTPYPTYTLLPTWTATIQPTYTPYPTYTPQYWTPSPTFTITPGGPTLTPTIMGTPPYYTPGACETARPKDVVNIPAWTEYEQCKLFYFFSVQPYHEQTLVALPTRYSTYEPMNSINKIGGIIGGIQTEIATAQWGTGVDGVNATPDMGQFIATGTAGPYGDGDSGWHPSDPPPSYDITCNAKIESVIGQKLGIGICWLLDILRKKHMLAFFQMTINIASIAIGWGAILSILKTYIRMS